MLDSRIEAENPSMIKAQIVAALKAMTHNLNYGERVSHILNSSSVWSEFKDQKHDLFITDSNIRGYLTGVFIRTAQFLINVLKIYSNNELHALVLFNI